MQHNKGSSALGIIFRHAMGAHDATVVFNTVVCRFWSCELCYWIFNVCVDERLGLL